MAHRYLNLVFQGGGVRGIAYAGVLDTMPDDIQIHAVGGTSAGAIAAALIAIGKDRNDLRRVLQSEELFKLIDAAEQERLDRLHSAWKDFSPLLDSVIQGKMPWILLARKLHKHREALKGGAQIWSDLGIHGTNRLRQFLEDTFEGKKFSEIKVDDLKIVAADVKNRCYITYRKQGYGEKPISEAVLASASIPIFFKPVSAYSGYLVDGGILSNFPSYLFAQAKFKTIGLRLNDLSRPAPIDSTFSYLLGLILTMAEAHDKERGNPPHFYAYEIETPPSITATKFNLSKEESEELFKAGRKVGLTNVKWDEAASDVEVISYYDPDSHGVLKFTIEQAFELWKVYSDKRLFVEMLLQDYVFTIKIDSDWTVHYERLGSLKVKGAGMLVLTRTMIEVPAATNHLRSLIDVSRDSICQEVSKDGEFIQNLIRIPAYNGETEKGFLLFYSPPLQESQEPRWFRTSFSVEKEFAENVARGGSGHISYIAKQLGIHHDLKLLIKVLVEVDSGMPELELYNESAETFVDTKRIEKDAASGKQYHVFECHFRSKIQHKFVFDADVRKKRVANR